MGRTIAILLALTAFTPALAGPDGRKISFAQLDGSGKKFDGKRIVVQVYLLDQGEDGHAAGYPVVGGNGDADRPVPVPNGCPTEQGIPMKGPDLAAKIAGLDGRRALISGVYHDGMTFLSRPSLNAEVIYDGYLDDVRLEQVFDDSCAPWKHTDNGLIGDR